MVAARTSPRSSLFASADRNGVAPEAARMIPAFVVSRKRAAGMPQHSAFSAAPAML
jgi:hypothetical protein